MFWYALLLLTGLIIGYAYGGHRSRRTKNQVLRDLNKRSLDLLDAKNSLNSLQNHASRQHRKNNLLTLTLRKLQHANTTVQEYKHTIATQQKRHNIEIIRLRLSLMRSRKDASVATEIAHIATSHLKRLEQASPVTQTIEAHEPKSYGSGEAVTVSVVDQANPDISSSHVSPVSNRDSMRLRKLHSSNEAASTA